MLHMERTGGRSANALRNQRASIAAIVLGLAACSAKESALPGNAAAFARSSGHSMSAARPDHTVIFTLKTIYRFAKPGVTGPGYYPQGTIAATKEGHLFGTTTNGGAYNGGIVFELVPTGKRYTFRLIHAFRVGDPRNDGNAPLGGLIQDASGAFFGTTTAGGSQNAGAVYKLTPSGKRYSESVIHSFGAGQDGSVPIGNLLLAADGKTLYGTTSKGGNYGEGTVYELVPGSGKAYSETILYSFKGYSYGDGANPQDGLVSDAHGTLFGTTEYGGSANLGTAFKIDPHDSHAKEAIIYTFAGSGAAPKTPRAPLIIDATGTLYGTAYEGGSSDGGSVFKLTRMPSFYQFYDLHDFQGASTKDGKWPTAGLAFGADGRLYGATTEGGAYCDGTGGCGTVFALATDGSGYHVAHDFKGSPRDGAWPFVGLTPYSSKFFGVTALGGNVKSCPSSGQYFPGCGIVFSLRP